MDVYMVVLRVIHVIFGVFWAGGTFVLISFILPTVAATGDEGRRFMQHLTQQTDWLQAFSGAILLNVLSGLLMYQRVFGWRIVFRGYGLGITVGSIAGLLAFLVGFLVIARSSLQMKAITVAANAAGGPPSQEQLAQLQTLGGRVAQGARINGLLLALAILGMAAAQYITA